MQVLFKPHTSSSIKYYSNQTSTYLCSQHTPTTHMLPSTNNFMNMNNFNPGFDLTMETAPSSHSLEPFQNSRMSRYEEDDNSTSIQQYYFTVIINEFPFLFLLLHLLSRQHYS
jgi:hypothetical protein